HAKDLNAWLSFARALAKGGGWVTTILPPEQLAVALTALSPDGRGAEVFPLWPKSGEPAKRIIVRVRTNARSPLRILPGLILHGTGARPTAEAEAVLRHGQALFK